MLFVQYYQLISFVRYELNATVEGNTSSASFLIFGCLAVYLISLLASTLANKYNDRYRVPPLMIRIYGLKRIFQIVIINKNDDPYNLSFKVIHIFKEDVIMVQESEEKSKLVSSGMTLLHKPFIESTPKTSKRSINFGESSSTQNIVEPSPQ